MWLGNKLHFFNGLPVVVSKLNPDHVCIVPNPDLNLSLFFHCCTRGSSVAGMVLVARHHNDD